MMMTQQKHSLRCCIKNGGKEIKGGLRCKMQLMTEQLLMHFFHSDFIGWKHYLILELWFFFIESCLLTRKISSLFELTLSTMDSINFLFRADSLRTSKSTYSSMLPWCHRRREINTFSYLYVSSHRAVKWPLNENWNIYWLRGYIVLWRHKEGEVILYTDLLSFWQKAFETTTSTWFNLFIYLNQKGLHGCFYHEILNKTHQIETKRRLPKELVE